MSLQQTVEQLKRESAQVPLDSAIEEAVEASVAYLGSDAALASLADDSYWPKWDSPWWHMVTLYEMGEHARIPEVATRAMVAALKRLPTTTFPIQPSDLPQGVDPWDASCHCALGCMGPLLLARGVDVDAELPWVRGWFGRYQMADGGLNCDSDAYLIKDEVASSMVGTVPPLEALLVFNRDTARDEDVTVMSKLAACMIGRGLVRGSDSKHNAEERETAPTWLELTFPRFYFYDVLRGLAALVDWAVRFERPLTLAAIGAPIEHLIERFPDGAVRIGRQGFAGRTTRLRSAAGAWTRGHPASTFPLLEAASAIGTVSAPLTRQWQRTREGLVQLATAGLLTAA